MQSIYLIKDLYPKYTKKDIKLSKKKKKIFKWAKDLNRPLTKEDIHIANKHMKKYLTSYFIRELTN